VIKRPGSISGSSRSRASGGVICSAFHRCGIEADPARPNPFAVMVVDTLKQGQHEGDVPKAAPIAALAEYYSTVLCGMALQSREGSSRKTLRQVMDFAKAKWRQIVGGAASRGLVKLDGWRMADDTFRNSHAAVRTDLVLAYSPATKSSIAWLTSGARSCWVQ
jgi:hypothetical protein